MTPAAAPAVAPLHKTSQCLSYKRVIVYLAGGLEPSTMASILEDVMVSQAYDFCHHRGPAGVKNQGAEERTRQTGSPLPEQQGGEARKTWEDGRKCDKGAF